MGDTYETIRVAAAQVSPVFLDREASAAKAVDWIARAAREGCQLVAFGEAWLPGYPTWIFIGSPSYCAPFSQKLYANAVEIPSATTDTLCRAAKDNNIHVVIGMTEKSGASLYLAQLIIDNSGHIVGHRRKLKPTHAERTIWGEGDGSDLIVVPTKIGNIGALNCWENLQPLTCFALNSMNEQIHVAAWPGFILKEGFNHSFSIESNLAVSRSYALMTQSYVLHVGPYRDQATVDMLSINDEAAAILHVGGGSCEVIDPCGKTIAGPLEHDVEDLVIADCDMSVIALAKMSNDPAGHYARADATQLVINRTPRRPVIYRDVDGEVPRSSAIPMPEEIDDAESGVIARGNVVGVV